MPVIMFKRKSIGYNEKTKYVHKDGPIVISQGIGHSQWGAFIQKANGSLKRFKPIEMCTHPTMVKMQLENYEGKALKKNQSMVKMQLENYEGKALKKNQCNL